MLRQHAVSPISPSSRRIVHRPSPTRRHSVIIHANLLTKIGRVLKEKSLRDIERLTKGMSKTQEKLSVVEELFTFWNLDDAEASLEELEEALIMSDFGPRTSLKLVDSIRPLLLSGELRTGAQIREALKQAIINLLRTRGGPTELRLESATRPSVILIVGVNGGGKTTTIGKLASKLRQQGAGVLLAPGDTFRAAAAEQLAEWATRSGAKMGPTAPSQTKMTASSSTLSTSSAEEVMEGEGTRRVARPDAILAASLDVAVADESIDVVICDTSGRLHTNYSLMSELINCKKRIAKKMNGAPHEVLLVLDGTTGLNMLNQAKEFNEAVQVTGLVLTKLDGTAKGGAVLSVVDELGVPVKFVGVGETVEDLQAFDVDVFVESLFPKTAAA